MADGSENVDGHDRKQIVKQWFDQLEGTLRSEARHAGLLAHGTLTGDAREFFVSRMLRTFLPRSVHIGTGRVLGTEGLSRQVDVILYDPRCPLLEIQAGVGLYLFEGVIATLEIKSELTTGKLRDALGNCNTVNDAGGAVEGPADLDSHARKQMAATRLPRECVEDSVKWSLVPRNYIFSFTTKMSTQSVTDTVVNWYQANGLKRTAYFPCLPAVIATEGTVGLLNDDWMQIDPGEDIRERMRVENGDDARVVMGFWNTSRQFGWLALRLLHDVKSRLGLSHLPTGTTLSLDSCLPAEAYFNEDCAGRLGHYVVWDRQSYLAAGGQK